MRRWMAALAFGILIATTPIWAEDIGGDVSGKRLMGAAAYALAALAKVGGSIEVQSPTSAVFHPYGLKAWKTADCTYAYQPTTEPDGRMYRISFRNLSGQYEEHGSTVVFYGTGSKPPVCMLDGSVSRCLNNLVIQNTYDMDTTINDTLYVTEHGCSPDQADLPGHRSPY